MRTEQWAHDRIYRERTVAGIRRSKGSPEARARFSKLLTERWNDSVMRAKYTAANAARNNPEHRERNRVRMLARWRDNDDFRALVAASMQLYWSNPVARERNSLRMRALWADPIWRMKQLVSMGAAGGASPAAAAAAAAAALNSATDLMQLVDSVIPRGLPEFARADICQDVMVALLDGSLKLADLREGSKQYLAAYRKMFPDKFGPVSLDEAIPGTDGLRRVDLIASDAAHF